MTLQFDAIVIGTGQAGPPLAARLSEAGKKVAVIERKLFGGTCVNTGCIRRSLHQRSLQAASSQRLIAIAPEGLPPRSTSRGRVEMQRGGLE